MLCGAPSGTCMPCPSVSLLLRPAVRCAVCFELSRAAALHSSTIKPLLGFEQKKKKSGGAADGPSLQEACRGRLRTTPFAISPRPCARESTCIQQQRAWCDHSEVSTALPFNKAREHRANSTESLIAVNVSRAQHLHAVRLEEQEAGEI